MPKGKVRLGVRLITDRIYNWHARLLLRPWFLRKPNYCGPIEPGMRFALDPGGMHNTIEIRRIGNEYITLNPCIYWNRVGWPSEYETYSHESELRSMIGADGKPERS